MPDIPMPNNRQLRHDIAHFAKHLVDRPMHQGDDGYSLGHRGANRVTADMLRDILLDAGFCASCGEERGSCEHTADEGVAV